MEVINPVLVGVVASICALYLAAELYLEASSNPKYAAARLFLKKETLISVLNLMVLSIIIFIAGRIVSLLILAGILSETVIYSIRTPIDLTVTILLAYSFAKIHSIIHSKRREK